MLLRLGDHFIDPREVRMIIKASIEGKYVVVFKSDLQPDVHATCKPEHVERFALLFNRAEELDAS